MYSLFLHIQRPHHSLNTSFTDGLMINFPTFTSKAIVGTSDIYLDAVPLSYDPDAMKSTLSIPSSTQDYCRNITDLPNSSSILQNFCGGSDHLIHDLKQFYTDVKTKCQLGFDIPAGFQQRSNHQQLFQLHTIL